MNLHSRHKPQWPYLTVEQRRKLALTAIVVAALALAAIVASQ